MTWVRLDDNFTEHPKIKPLSHGAFRLHVEGLCWSARWLTDGFVPIDQPPILVRPYRPAFVTELTSRGSWEAVEGGWQIHDYLEFQQSAAKVRSEREAAAGRMRRKRSSVRSSPEHPPNNDRSSASPDPVSRIPTPPSLPTPSVAGANGNGGSADAEGWGAFEAKGPNEDADSRQRRRGLALRWQSVLAERGTTATHGACNEVVAELLHVADWKVVDEQIGWFLESTVAPRGPRALEAAVKRKAYR